MQALDLGEPSTSTAFSRTEEGRHPVHNTVREELVESVESKDGDNETVSDSVCEQVDREDETPNLGRSLRVEDDGYNEIPNLERSLLVQDDGYNEVVVRMQYYTQKYFFRIISYR